MRAVATLVSLAALLMLVAGCAQHQSWPLAAGQHPQSFTRVVPVRADGHLLLYLPAGFDARGATRYPLLIFLHGSGEGGNDLEKLRTHGPPKLVADKSDFPFIVASPQSILGSYGGFDPAMLNAMLDELLARLPIDPERVYLTGLSMGGIWSYGWASLHPERFAAIVPISGAWDPVDACRLKGVPVRAYHGALDTVVPLGDEQAMIDAIRACGGDAQLTIYAESGHDAWTQTYENPQLYEWLLSQHRRHAAR